MTFDEATVRQAIDQDLLTRAFRARLEISRMDGEELVYRYREDTARVLLSVGITLIPSDHLTDNQFVVSRGVYEAARRLAAGGHS